VREFWFLPFEILGLFVWIACRRLIDGRGGGNKATLRARRGLQGHSADVWEQKIPIVFLKEVDKKWFYRLWDGFRVSWISQMNPVTWREKPSRSSGAGAPAVGHAAEAVVMATSSDVIQCVWRWLQIRRVCALHRVLHAHPSPQAHCRHTEADNQADGGAWSPWWSMPSWLGRLYVLPPPSPPHTRTTSSTSERDLQGKKRKRNLIKPSRHQSAEWKACFLGGGG